MNKHLLFHAVVTCMVFLSGCKKDAPIEVPQPETQQKEILVSPYSLSTNSGTLQVLDYNGNLIKEKVLAASAVNFQRWYIKGKVRYTYIENDINSYRMAGVGYIPGPAVILDKDLNEVKRVWLEPHNGRTSADPNAVDGHDFILLDDDHYITLTYYEKKVNNIPAHLNPAANVRVNACLIQEVKNGNVIMEWDGTNYPELYEASVEGNDYTDTTKVLDYLHINSIFIDPRDNNFICSFRNTDQVLKIHRTTGEIIWRLGGKNSDFPLTADQKFLRQHHATILDDNETLLLFDNGHNIERPYTRILEFKLNEAGKSVTSFNVFNLPNNTFCQYMGSVQKIGDLYFVGGGTAKKIMEVNYVTGEVVLDKELPNNTYRAFKY